MCVRRVAGMPALQRHGGYTLLELLLTSAIGVILFGVMLVAFLALLKAADIIGVRTALTGDFRTALEYFGRDIEQAREAPASCPGGTYSVSATRVVLNIPGVGDCVVYQCASGSCSTATDPGQLERLIAPGGGPALETHAIARSVIALAFTRQDVLGADGIMDRVDIDLGLLRARGGFQAQSRIIARYRLRNQQ